jgi:hypothetical protein
MSKQKENKKRKHVNRYKKYLFEFLLVFLAVFLGFIAENVREGFVEKQQAKELAKSFYDELKKDSVTVAEKVRGRIKKEKSLEFMISFFSDSNLYSSSKVLSINFEWATTVRTPTIFTPRTVVLEQIKNSGYLRYLKSDTLQLLIGNLSVAIDYINARQELEASVYQNYIEPIFVRHMDFDWQNKILQGGIFDKLNEYEKNNAYIPFKLTQPEKIDRKSYSNILSYYQINNIKSTRLLPFEDYIKINAALLREIRKEFDIR